MAMKPIGNDFKLMTPIAPDIKSPLRAGSDLTPRQTFNQLREAAQSARQNAYRTAIEMPDIVKRQEAKAAAQSAYKNAVEKARDAFNIAKAGPRTGGDMLPSSKAPITNMGPGSGLAPKAGQTTAPVASVPTGMKKGGKTTVMKTVSKGRKCDW
jgi:hypothetical protein